MRKNINKEKIEGRLFSHTLELKTVKDQNSANFGKEFIAGTVEIAVDEDGLNVIPVHYTYVTEMTSKGSKNKTFEVLRKIINEGKDWASCGKENAVFVKAEPSLALTEFYKDDDTLVSVKANEGGFISFVTSLEKNEAARNIFEVDMLITNVNVVEPDEEKHIDEKYAEIQGAIFNFKNDLLPVSFVVRDEAGINYFDDLGISNSEPVYTKVWGRINCLTKTETITEKSAFGAAAVKTVKKTSKEWLIEGVLENPYDFGDEKVLTADEVNTASQNRQVHLAELKKRRDEYEATKKTSAPTGAMPSAGTVKTGGFQF